MSILKNLNFAPIPEASKDPVVQMREKVIARLIEQKHLVEDPNLVRVEQHWKGKGEERTHVTQQKTVRSWFKELSGGQFALSVLVSGAPVEFQPGKAAVMVKSKDELLSVIDGLAEVIRAGEFDRFLVKGKSPAKTAKNPKAPTRAS